MQPRRTTNQNAHNNLYGDGAPHGDPFAPPTMPSAASGPQYIGLGLPSFANSKNMRAGPHNTPLPPHRTQDNGRHAASHNILAGQPADGFIHHAAFQNTPTPANRYQPPSAQFRMPERRSQMDLLVDMMAALLDDNVEVKEHISSIETRITAIETTLAQVGSSSVQGGGMRHGDRITRSKQRAAAALPAAARDRQRQPPDTSDNQSIDPSLLPSDSEGSITDYSTDNDDSQSESVDEDGVELSQINLSDVQKRALQTVVTQVFRKVCDVPGKYWPDPNIIRTNEYTGQVYPTPFFELQVSDAPNMEVLREVAEQVIRDLQVKKDWPKALMRTAGELDPTWDRAYIIALAKKSFSSFRKQWKKNHQVQAGNVAIIDDRNNRRNKRRQRKSKQLDKIRARYAVKYGLSDHFLRDLFDEQYLSDEVSSPEDDSDETVEDWTARLKAAAVAANMPINPKMPFLELLTPDWRSSRYSDLIHDAEDFRFNQLSDAQQSSIKYNRVGVSRRSDRVPVYAPYNFGIASEWLDEHRNKPVYRTLLKGWGHHPEPEGCGVSTWAPESQIDERFNFNFEE
ncbi:hypothetical protein B0H14DRAFT_3148632 [Mycena olivaceomarginata]|nr:hypothetical protein B0H14DRAFT_3148632 [Mycena olivaceomarginata]